MCEQVSLCDCVRREVGGQIIVPVAMEHEVGSERRTKCFLKCRQERIGERRRGSRKRREEDWGGRKKKSGEGNKVERMRGKNSEKKGWNKGVQRNNGWRMEWGKRHK